MNNPIRLIAVALIGVFAVAACGQKGPLFLPGNPSEMRPQTPEEARGQDESEDDQGEEDRDEEDRSEPPR